MSFLLDIKPHKVSRDLSGYITYIYGSPKVGKTTLGSKMPKPLLLAFERGYNALPGVMAYDMTSWADMRKVMRELKKNEVKEQFSTIVIDTVDIAASCCEKYVCNQNDVDSISKIPYGQGWNLLKKEFEEVFRNIAQMGYAVYFISHVKEGAFKNMDGTEYSTIRPTVSNTYNNIIENMADIYGYMHPVYEDGVSSVKITLRSLDGSVTCGGRFKYIQPEIDGTYEALVQALREAIDQEAELNGNQYVTDEKLVYNAKTYDYDEYMSKAKELINGLINKVPKEEFDENYAPKIRYIINQHLGKDKKLSDATRGQVEQLVLIVSELEEL